MNYIISEELRDRLIANLEANAMADWYAVASRDQAEKLRNLTPVQSGGAVTREAITLQRIYRLVSEVVANPADNDMETFVAIMTEIEAIQLPTPTPQDFSIEADHRREDDLEFNQVVKDQKCQCTMSKSILGDGCRYCQPQEYIDRLHDQIEEERKERDGGVFSRPLIATPQPEARGVDLSKMERLMPYGDSVGVFFRPHPNGTHVRFDDLAHLQQAPQGVGEWIPVTEKLPENDSKVLVHGYEWNDKENPSFQMVCLYKNGFHSWIDDPSIKDGGYWSESDNVYAFHWQPLPPAPVKVDNHE